MEVKIMRWFLVLMAVFLGIVQGALANDSEAELALGGLTLVPSDAVSLESEDLYLSKEEVRVRYEFTNTSGADVETLVAFPLPDQVFSEEDDSYFRDFRSALGFETTVDGVPISYDIIEQAFMEGRDITARITGLGLLLNNAGDPEGFTQRARALAEADRKALLEEGVLIAQEYDQGQGLQTYYQPAWTLRLNITRKQVFPAGKRVRVEHRYTPLAGGSVGGSLMAQFRKEEWTQFNRKKYCIEDSWYRAFDKAIAPKVSENNSAPYTEVWLGYVLKSGANWKGPIKDFRLVVDKGKPENMVSFCAEGVKKISPTQFEVRKKDFEPDRDLDVLIVEWAGE
jgi:hypothetical protein